MMIFDRFPDKLAAEAFAAHVRWRYQLPAFVIPTNGIAQGIDPFPYVLEPPIVLVERSDRPKLETKVERRVLRYGGTFAGT